MTSSVSLFLGNPVAPTGAPPQPTPVAEKPKPEPAPPPEPEELVDEFDVASVEGHMVIGRMIVTAGTTSGSTATFIQNNAQSITDRVSRWTGARNPDFVRDALLKEVKGYRAYAIPPELTSLFPRD